MCHAVTRSVRNRACFRGLCTAHKDIIISPATAPLSSLPACPANAFTLKAAHTYFCSGQYHNKLGAGVPANNCSYPNCLGQTIIMSTVRLLVFRWELDTHRIRVIPILVVCQICALLIEPAKAKMLLHSPSWSIVPSTTPKCLSHCPAYLPICQPFYLPSHPPLSQQPLDPVCTFFLLSINTCQWLTGSHWAYIFGDHTKLFCQLNDALQPG